jgi:hypothetical protein
MKMKTILSVLVLAIVAGTCNANWPVLENRSEKGWPVIKATAAPVKAAAKVAKAVVVVPVEAVIAFREKVQDNRAERRVCDASGCRTVATQSVVAATVTKTEAVAATGALVERERRGLPIIRRFRGRR